MHGPIEQLLSYIFACVKYKGFSPSICLLVMSFPIEYPIITLFINITASSASGTFQFESERIPTGSPGFTSLAPVDLKKISGLSAL